MVKIYGTDNFVVLQGHKSMKNVKICFNSLKSRQIMSLLVLYPIFYFNQEICKISWSDKKNSKRNGIIKHIKPIHSNKRVKYVPLSYSSICSINVGLLVTTELILRIEQPLGCLTLVLLAISLKVVYSW